jgi:hypothetical protein
VPAPLLFSRKAFMKKLAAFCLVLYSAISVAGEGAARTGGEEVTRVATALEHLTVLEFGEPVTMLAAGSSSFQIERHEDKVFVKPLRAGASTNLLVWTQSRRLIYELEAPGEVNHMNFALDSRVIAPTPAVPAARTDENVDSIMARTFLAALPVDSRALHERKQGVTLRIEHVLFSKRSVYLHYSIRNRGTHACPLRSVAVEQLVPLRAGSPFFLSPARVQLNEERVRKLGPFREVAISTATIQMSAEQVGAGETVEGVIALPQPAQGKVLLQVIIPGPGAEPMRALVVL